MKATVRGSNSAPQQVSAEPAAALVAIQGSAIRLRRESWPWLIHRAADERVSVPPSMSFASPVDVKTHDPSTQKPDEPPRGHSFHGGWNETCGQKQSPNLYSDPGLRRIGGTQADSFHGFHQVDVRGTNRRNSRGGADGRDAFRTEGSGEPPVFTLPCAAHLRAQMLTGKAPG